MKDISLTTISLLAIALAVTACGKGASPGLPSRTTTSAPQAAVPGDCGSFLRPGPIAFNGIVISVGEPMGGYPAYGNGWQVMNVRVETTSSEASTDSQGRYSAGNVVDVNLVDPFFPIVAPGDCVAVAGSEREFPCVGITIGRLSCDNFGFVADDFDVLTVE